MQNRNGTAILALLVVIVIGGVMATRLIPSYEIQEKRQADNELKFTLAQIRQAFDLKYMADPTYDPGTTSASISAALDLLKTENFLGDALLKDKTILSYQWSTGTAQPYWVSAGNIASNTGFEETDSGSGLLASWTTTPGTTIATSPVSMPGNLDDYSGQNKLGNTLSNLNTVLKLTK